ncbi:MAG: hypothetical protein KME04_07425 [Pleurocapsa minor GSE-CHR-MK-17-07R]|jgi:hypothetical protein|nr:hypothetical protein [Pleurocapsa minor GSE-CHR-MK 17-07R]
MQSLTRGGVTAGKIKNLLKPSDVVNFMFNPFEYTITKQNTWTPNPTNSENAPRIQFSQGGAQTLTLVLFFDTLAEGTNVTDKTKKLWDMTMIDDTTRNSETQVGTPPDVEFSWGALVFRAVITQISEQYTLFKEDGTPVRSKVTVNLQQRIPEAATPAQDAGADSAASPAASAPATGSDRPDNMVSNPDDMRSAMANSGVDNPLNVARGTPIAGA